MVFIVFGSKSLYCFKNAFNVSFSVCFQHSFVDSFVKAIN